MFLYCDIWLSKWGLGKSIGCTLKISGHRVVLVVPQLTHVFYNGFKMMIICGHFQPIIACFWSSQWECYFTLKPALWLFVDLFLKVGKWVLNCAAGVKLVGRWFIGGIVSAHALQIRCYRWHKIRVIMIEKIIVPDYFLDQCKNWLRDLCDHNSDILRVLQNLKITLVNSYWSWRSTNQHSSQISQSDCELKVTSYIWQLTDALCHWIKRKCTRIRHWVYFRYLNFFVQNF